MVKFWKGTREQSENFEGNTGTRTPPGRPSLLYVNYLAYEQIFFHIRKDQAFSC
jgi:hypothetical protein